MNKADRFHYLLRQYVAGTLSTAEHEELFGLLSTPEYDAALDQHIQNDLAEGESGQHADLPPHIAQEIIRNIFSSEKNTADILPLQKHIFPIWHWAAAASVILIAVTAYLFSSGYHKTGHGSLASLIPKSDLIQKNNTDTQQLVLLSDGSKVFLKPRSSIHYPAAFAAGSREVYLEGEAFFQVAKNPQKPFFVFYNTIVTRVLGTSFTINTNAKTGNLEVSVKTGRVQVYENDQILTSAYQGKGVIVTPNQRAIYKTEKRAFETTLVETPLPVPNNEQGHESADATQSPGFVYDQEKLRDIFIQLEAVYGIEIVVENTNLYNCVFTGDVSVHDLFTKLKIICLTINSTFEINGTKILIRGKGCN